MRIAETFSKHKAAIGLVSSFIILIGTMAVAIAYRPIPKGVLMPILILELGGMMFFLFKIPGLKEEAT